MPRRLPAFGQPSVHDQRTHLFAKRWGCMRENVSRRSALAAIASGTTASLSAQLPPGADQPRSPAPIVQGGGPMIRTRPALDRLREIGSGVGDTGAIGDGRADDTPALQEIADHFGRNGGEWHMPQGVFRTSAPLRWEVATPQRIRGRGIRGVYPGAYDPAQSNTLAVIMPAHTGRAAIEFTSAREGGGAIEIAGLALATREAGPVPVAAFGWDASRTFLRDFRFLDCSIHGFASAFDLYRTGGPKREMGLFRASRCTINRNSWIARTLDGTQWNGFSFCDNEAGQNGYLPAQGGIAISAHNAVVAGNCLEGQRDPIRLYGGMRGVSVRDNYFEANVGTAAIHLQNIRGPFDIGANSFLDIRSDVLDHTVLLTNCGHGRVVGPYWADGVHKMDLPVLGNSAVGDNDLNPRVSSAAHGLLRMDGFYTGNSFTRSPSYSAIARNRVAVAGRALAPWNGQPMPVGRHDTGRSRAIACNYRLSGKTNDWVVVSWLFRRDGGRGYASDPYLSVDVNQSGAAGSRDYVANDFDVFWRDDEWCLMTAAVRLGVPITTLAARLYPHGLNPQPGRRTSYLNPVAYVTDAAAKVVPFVDDHIARSVITPPQVGGFEPGDILMNGAIGTDGRAYYVKLGGAASSWGPV